MAALKMIITLKSEERSIDQAHIKPSVPKLYLKVANIFMITQTVEKAFLKCFIQLLFKPSFEWC